MTNRRSIRKPEHNYATQGHYFVTLCVPNRDPLLGDIVGEAMRLSDLGKIVREEWLALPKRFPTVRLDAFTIMPNHMHGIVTIVGVPLAGTPSIDQPHGIDTGNSHATDSDTPTDRAGASPAPTLGTIIGAFKSLSDRRCRTTAIAGHPNHRFGRLWQKNYYDHIVIGKDELERIRAYIVGNVRAWRNDLDYVPLTQRWEMPTGRSTKPRDLSLGLNHPTRKGFRMSGTERSKIHAGLEVNIVQKHHQRSGTLTNGIVKDILTKSSTHPHGIKVRLESGEVGRVKEILSKT